MVDSTLSFFFEKRGNMLLKYLCAFINTDYVARNQWPGKRIVFKVKSSSQLIL